MLTFQNMVQMSQVLGAPAERSVAGRAQKVSGTNGTVVLLRARNVTYWRTVDFCKLPFVRVGID